MTETVVGDEQKQKQQLPSSLTTASTAAEALVGDEPTSEADRDRIFRHRARPYMTALDNEKKNLNKYFEAQGLRFSTERRDELLDATDRRFTQIGESVMVPQIERERAERRADIGLAADIGTREAQIGLQDRQVSVQEINAALDRAVQQGRETGTFVDPVTNVEYDTLASQAQTFSQGIEERRTTVLEAEAAMQRAEARGRATGVFIDPVTGESIETLDARRLELESRVQRAAQTGLWIEDDVNLDIESMLEQLGIDLDEYLGEPSEDEPPAPPPDDDPDPRTADDIVHEIRETEQEIMFLQTVPTWAEQMGVPADSLIAIVEAIGTQESEALFDLLASGAEVDMGTILDMFTSDATDTTFDGYFMFTDVMGDWLTVTATSDDPRQMKVRLATETSQQWSGAVDFLNDGKKIPKDVWEGLSAREQASLQKHPRFAVDESTADVGDTDGGGLLETHLFPLEQAHGSTIARGTEMRRGDVDHLRANGFGDNIDALVDAGWITVAARPMRNVETPREQTKDPWDASYQAQKVGDGIEIRGASKEHHFNLPEALRHIQNHTGKTSGEFDLSGMGPGLKRAVEDAYQYGGIVALGRDRFRFE